MSHRNVNILLIEDNPSDVRFIEELLKEADDVNFKLECFNRLNNGLNHLEKKNFDVVLLDLSLPDSNGLDSLLETLKIAENVSVIVLTGTNNDFLALKSVKKGAQDYLVKSQINCTSLIRSIKYSIERKKLEQQLKKSKLSEEKFRTIVKTSPYSIILLDIKGDIMDCNLIAEKYLFLPKNMIIGKNIIDLPIISENNKYLICNQVKELMRRNIVEPREFKYTNYKGETRWLENILTYIKVGENDYIQFVSEDITERKKMEIIIKNENEKLKDLDRIKRDITSRISHELKTPLMSINGASELLLSTYSDQIGDKAIELIEIIHRGGKRLLDLVVNVINVSQIEFNKLELNKKKHNLCKIITDCAKEMSHLVNKRSLTLTFDLPDIFCFEFDKLKIEQIIMNLLSNAIKNTPPYGEIIMTLKKKGGWAELWIKDTGVGLTKEEMKKIFTRFGKLERYEKGIEYLNIQGSGLGLFISKKIVNLHGGQIWAESGGRNKGSTFVVKIPLNEKYNYTKKKKKLIKKKVEV